MDTLTKTNTKKISNDYAINQVIKPDDFNRDIEINKNFNGNEINNENSDSFGTKLKNLWKNQQFRLILNPFRNDVDPTMRYCYYCMWVTVIFLFSMIFLFMAYV